MPDTPDIPSQAAPSTADEANSLAARTAAAARETAIATARKTADGIDNNPLSVLVGGLAVGVLAGALIPRLSGEARLFGGVGRQVTKGAGTAVKAARNAAQAELVSAGLDRSGVREQIGKFFNTIGNALNSASEAAKNASKKGE